MSEVHRVLRRIMGATGWESGEIRVRVHGTVVLEEGNPLLEQSRDERDM